MQTNWVVPALRTAFYVRLVHRKKDELARLELPITVDGLIQLCLRIDQQMSSRPRPAPGSTYVAAPRIRTSYSAPTTINPLSSVDHTGAGGELMQLGHSYLSQEERDRRYCEGLCAYCVSPIHHRAVSGWAGPVVISFTSPSVSRLTIQTHIQLGCIYEFGCSRELHRSDFCCLAGCEFRSIIPDHKNQPNRWSDPGQEPNHPSKRLCNLHYRHSY